MNRLNAETLKSMKQPEFQRILKDTGSEYVGDTPENFAAFVKAEGEKWGKSPSRPARPWIDASDRRSDLRCRPAQET